MCTAACVLGELSDYALHEHGHGDLHIANRCCASFLAHDGNFCVDIEWIVSANLATETVLQWCDDATTVGVVLGVCRSNQHHIEWQANLVATNLHIALFQHVKQTHLNALGKVGQFVNGEDATVGAWHHAVVQREFVAEVSTFSNLDGVDFTNEVRD